MKTFEGRVSGANGCLLIDHTFANTSLEFDTIIAQQWNCTYCEEENPGHFHVCWNCSNQRIPPGIEMREELYGPSPTNMLSNPLSSNEIRFDKNHLK